MPDSSPVGGLHWVRSEILASLKRVRTWLESVVEGGAPSGDAQEAVAALSEVRGVLAALQLTGPARLAEEMQALCEQLGAGTIANTREAGEALMLALIQLPDHLERLQAGRPDSPATLLGAINDLRSSRGLAILSEAEILLPASVLVDSELTPPEVRESLGRIAAKVRPHYHRSLLQWFRPESSRQGLVSLGRLFHQTQRYAQEGVFHDLFLAAEAVIEGLSAGSIPTNTASKAVIGRIDRVIKPLAEDPGAWPETQAQAILVDLLALVARSDSESLLIDELRERYGLTQGPAAGEAPAFGPGGEALAMLAAEARRELVPIKDVLDLYARGTREDPRQLGELGGKLRGLANTLAIAGMDDLVAHLQRCSDDCMALAEQPVDTNDERLSAAAEGLVRVESALADLAVGGSPGGGEGGNRELLVVTLKEAGIDMARAEQAIAELAAGPGNPRLLAEVPKLFQRVAGALRILAENDAADVLDAVVTQVRRRLLPGGRTPAARELELLANAISGVELYVEGLTEGERYRPNLIAEARAAIDELAGLPGGAVRPVALAPTVAEEPVSIELPAIAIEQPAETEELLETAEAASVAPIDPEFLEIFLEEAEEVEQTIRDQFSRWGHDPSDREALTELRRAFHTLKGSGRLVGAERVGELSRVVEALLNRVIDGTVEPSPALIAFMAEVVAFTPEIIAAEANASPLDINDKVERAEALALGQSPEIESEGTLETPAGAKVIPWPVARTLPETGAAGPESALAAPEEETERVAEAEYDAATAVEIAALADADEELLEIFRTEAADHLGVLSTFLTEAAEHPEGLVPADDAVRALHTLTGSARMTGVESSARATWALEHIFAICRDTRRVADPAALDLLTQTLAAVKLRLDHLPGAGSEIATLQRLAEAASSHLAGLTEQTQAPASEPELAGPDSGEVPATAGLDQGWEFVGEEIIGLAPPWDIEEEPAGEAERSIGPEGLLGTESIAEIESVVAEQSEEPVETAGLAEPSEGLAVTEAEAPLTPTELPEPQEEASVPIELEGAPSESLKKPAAELPSEAPSEIGAEIYPAAEVEAEPAPAVEELPAPAEPQPLAAAAQAEDLAPLPAEPELLGLFLEDARDILDKLDQRLRELQLAPTDTAPLEALQRLLHTLKGSARLAGLAPIGDVSHALESLLTAIAHGDAPADDHTLDLAQQTLDVLSSQVDAVAKGIPLHRARDLVQTLALTLEQGLAGPLEPIREPAPAAPPVRPAQPEPEPHPLGKPGTVEPAVPQIRVRGDLLNRLVNDAGEISIYRSRLAQHSGVQGFRLGELGQTVERLREQLRKMEIETEAQILHRFERDSEARGPDRADFDPLELDRFSTLQQLSRSLAETVNDLVSLRVLLADLQSESDTLLLQQARIIDDLQDGLLRTRMVPFSQIVPRLQRLVRQTAQQVGKKARLEVVGSEVELDRGIQERILAPLEHLLRNALAHGIESPEQRAAAGKPSNGRVSLSLTREGNDVVIRVDDDGGGLDLAAIRRRAVQRGLLVEGAPISDDELAQLVLESGFSTVEQVTQIAGRGVGLDVVNAEIKQLSGSFNLESLAGQGTSFTVRLPLTLAIIEVLLVEVAGEVVAVPHTTIEAVSRISRDEVAACHRGEGTDFSYAGEDYRVLYLGTMLHLVGAPELGERRWLPLLLARSGDQRVAFHVDQLRGSQRIVVKPLGPQLSSIRWLSGGTILPDGRVALILDPITLIRSGAVHDYVPPMRKVEDEGERSVCVMVVDDSLTVRRVTGRMLRRQDMEVITAQDGIEALTLLEERIPDVILLDIEMPRMDGYELTRHIRRSPRFRDIPIIMITSRTGDKHRRLALELGVDRYLGKPYQETELLDEISSVLVEGAL
jgi:chemosensory pili system protein ChpA (sensor histidine kinase/response regulator)